MECKFLLVHTQVTFVCQPLSYGRNNFSLVVRSLKSKGLSTTMSFPMICIE